MLTDSHSYCGINAQRFGTMMQSIYYDQQKFLISHQEIVLFSVSDSMLIYNNQMQSLIDFYKKLGCGWLDMGVVWVGSFSLLHPIHQPTPTHPRSNYIDNFHLHKRFKLYICSSCISLKEFFSNTDYCRQI